MLRNITEEAAKPWKQYSEMEEAPHQSIHPSRHTCASARRVIVKVGTAVVMRSQDSRLAVGRLGALVEQLEALVRSGRQVILVTSGAKAVGLQKMRFQRVRKLWSYKYIFLIIHIQQNRVDLTDITAKNASPLYSFLQTTFFRNFIAEVHESHS